MSETGQVLISSPAQNTTLKLGDELSVRAVLVDPKLDIMIRGIEISLNDSEAVLTPRLSVMFGSAVAIPLIYWLPSGKTRKRYKYLPILSVLALLAWIGSGIALKAINNQLNNGRQQYEKLTPQVKICSADGEVVAQGLMPYG